MVDSQSSFEILSSEIKVKRQRGNHWHGRSVELVGREIPLPNGAEDGFIQGAVSLRDSGFCNQPALVNLYFGNYLADNAFALRIRRIGRIDLVDYFQGISFDLHFLEAAP